MGRRPKLALVQGDKSAPAPRSIEQFSTFRITILAGNLSTGTARMLSTTYGLNLASWRTLCILQFEGPCTPSEICLKGGIDKAHMSRSRPVLEKRGLIRRIPGKTSKRYLLEITRSGTELFNTVNPAARAREKKLLSALTESEREIFDKCLSKLYRISMGMR